jgi:hypothetical protein
MAPEKIRLYLPCQHLYSKESAGFICISQLFGTSQFWCFIAETFTTGLLILIRDTEEQLGRLKGQYRRNGISKEEYLKKTEQTLNARKKILEERSKSY